MVNVESEKIRLILVAGGSYDEREKIISDATVNHHQITAIILEGLPSGKPLLQTHHSLLVERIAPGCFCCTGQLVMQVSLHRMIRKQPQFLYISIANTEHLGQLQAHLSQTSYQAWLELENVIQLPSSSDVALP